MKPETEIGVMQLQAKNVESCWHLLETRKEAGTDRPQGPEEANAVITLISDSWPPAL